MAHTARRYDRAADRWVDGDTTYLSGSVWGAPAEHVAASLRRGDRVLLTGRLRQRDYTTAAGEKRSVFELDIDEVGVSLRYATAAPRKAAPAGANGNARCRLNTPRGRFGLGRPPVLRIRGPQPIRAAADLSRPLDVRKETPKRVRSADATPVTNGLQAVPTSPTTAGNRRCRGPTRRRCHGRRGGGPDGRAPAATDGRRLLHRPGAVRAWGGVRRLQRPPGRQRRGLHGHAGAGARPTARAAPHLPDLGAAADPLVGWDLAGGRLPVLSVNPRRGRTPVRWSAIAAGREDAVIRAQARSAAALHAPLLLSFSHEPENDRNDGPAAYVAAWRHYVAVFRAEHATNVRFAWILMASSFHQREGRIPAAAYYPGDDVIDWIAADGYNWYACRSTTWRPFADVFHDFITWATPHHRPLMVAEWGSLEDPASPSRKGRWIAAAGAAIHRWPQLRAVLYWNSAGRGGRCAFNLNSSASAMAAMRALAAQRYLAARFSA